MISVRHFFCLIVWPWICGCYVLGGIGVMFDNFALVLLGFQLLLFAALAFGIRLYIERTSR